MIQDEATATAVSGETPTFTKTEYALDIMERISLGLPNKDPETGEPFAPVKRTEIEKEALRRARDAEARAEKAEWETAAAKRQVNYARIDALLAESRLARERSRGGFFSYFWPW